MAITAPLPITSGPPVPDSGDAEATFDAMFETFNAWQKNHLEPEANALGINVYNNAQEVASLAAAVAAAQITVLAAQAAALSASNFKGTWSTRTGAAAVPYSVAHLGAIWMLLSNIADVTVKVPGTATEWQRIDGQPVQTVSTTSVTAIAGVHYVFRNPAVSGGILPTVFAVGDKVRFSQANYKQNTVDAGTATVYGPSWSTTGIITMDLGASMEFIAISPTEWLAS